MIALKKQLKDLQSQMARVEKEICSRSRPKKEEKVVEEQKEKKEKPKVEKKEKPKAEKKEKPKAEKKEKPEKKKRTISPEHLAKMRAGRMKKMGKQE